MSAHVDVPIRHWIRGIYMSENKEETTRKDRENQNEGKANEETYYK